MLADYSTPVLFGRPGFIARRLCPELVFVKPDFSKYSKASHKVQEIFRQYDTEMDAASLDEAYMDVTDYCRLNNMAGMHVARDAYPNGTHATLG